MSDIPKLPRCKTDDDNMEKLHQAARRGQTELVRRLLSSGINVNIPNKFGCTALHLACKNNHLTTVKELASKANINVAWHGRKPLHLAVAAGNKDLVAALVESARIQGLSADSILGENDDYEMQEIGKFRKHCTGQTPLHYAIGLQNKEMVAFLLSQDASPTARDKSGETCIHRAIEFGDDDIFNMLMERNPNLDSTDRSGRSMLHYACIYNRPTMAMKLLGAGADPNIEDTDRITPIHLAAQQANVKLLQVMLPLIDPDAFLQYTIHNGREIVEDRLNFSSGTPDERADTVRELQARLETVLRDRGADLKGKGKTAPALHVAPSAPIKK